MDIRPLFPMIACLIAGPFCIYRYYAGQPALFELAKISAEVKSIESGTRQSKLGTVLHPTIRLRGVSTSFHYLDWFPEPELLEQKMKPGDEVTVWVDKGQNNWLWQIERDGQMIVKYEDIAAAVRRNNRFDLLIGVALIMAAIFSSGWLWHINRNANRKAKSHIAPESFDFDAPET